LEVVGAGIVMVVMIIELWIGINWTKWLGAKAGVRRSKTRMWESDVAEEMIEG